MTSNWIVAVSLVLAGCTEVRQIVLSIDTTAGVPCDIDGVRIRATSSAATTTFERSLRDSRLPVTITLLDDTPDGGFALEVIGLKDDAEVMVAAGNVQFSGREVQVPVLLEPRCVAGGPPCALSEPAPGGPSAVTSRFKCGPPVSAYGIRSATETFQDACSASGSHIGKVLIDGSRGPVLLNDLESVLPGFNFQFYGRPIHQIWVHRDGFISFARQNPDPGGDLDPGPFDRELLGIGTPPPPQSVMVLWDKLALREGIGVCYDFRDDPGNQLLRVTWGHACLTNNECTTDDLNFTITLNENGQTIMFTYGTMRAGSPDRARGATATVGLVNEANGCPVSDCALDTGLCADGVTPCDYSQVFSSTVQNGGIANVLFTPIPDAR